MNSTARHTHNHTRGGERILSLVMTFCVLQQVQHVRDGGSDGRALRYYAKIQIVSVLLEDLQNC